MGKGKGKGKTEGKGKLPKYGPTGTESETGLTHPYSEVKNSIAMGTGFSKTYEVHPFGEKPVFYGDYDAAVEYAIVYGPDHAPYGLFVRRMMMWELALLGMTEDPEAATV